MYGLDALFTAQAQWMSFALCEFEFRVFYWQRCSDVYFTYSGLLIMHYSKRYKNCHSQGKGTECVFLIISDFCIHVHTQYNKALFFPWKCNKLSAALQHFFLLDAVVNSRGLQPLFFISWIPRWDDTGAHHHISIALRHIYTSRVYYLGCRNFFFTPLRKCQPCLEALCLWAVLLSPSCEPISRECLEGISSNIAQPPSWTHTKWLWGSGQRSEVTVTSQNTQFTRLLWQIVMFLNSFIFQVLPPS